MEKDDQRKEVEMFVAGLVLDPASNAPIVVLKDTEGDTCLPIWIGLAEATAIASALKKVELVRPMTHDLLKNVIDEMGGRVVRVIITELHENTFISNIEVAVGDVMKVIDSRPSDAIALAVRTDAPIIVAAEVLKQAQVTLVAVSTGEDGEEEFGIAGAEGEVGETNFANIEKEKWEEILAEMDPDDFKYKM
jgi:bifunctional DNase/RNase